MASENTESKTAVKKPYVIIFHGFSIPLRNDEDVIEARRLIHQLSSSITFFDGKTLGYTDPGNEILDGETVQCFPRNGWKGSSTGLFLTIMKRCLFISCHIDSTEDDEDPSTHDSVVDPSPDDIQRFYEMVFSNSPDNKIYQQFKNHGGSRQYHRSTVIVQ